MLSLALHRILAGLNMSLKISDGTVVDINILQFKNKNTLLFKEVIIHFESFFIIQCLPWLKSSKLSPIVSLVSSSRATSSRGSAAYPFLVGEARRGRGKSDKQKY